MTATQNARPWPEWTAITTQWNGPYDDPAHPDPDQYTATCYRCQDSGKVPFSFDGTLNDCVNWAYGHEGDKNPHPQRPPHPTTPNPPVTPNPKGHLK